MTREHKPRHGLGLTIRLGHILLYVTCLASATGGLLISRDLLNTWSHTIAMKATAAPCSKRVLLPTLHSYWSVISCLPPGAPVQANFLNFPLNNVLPLFSPPVIRWLTAYWLQLRSMVWPSHAISRW